VQEKYRQSNFGEQLSARTTDSHGQFILVAGGFDPFGADMDAPLPEI
jgi:hypothetical protein